MDLLPPTPENVTKAIDVLRLGGVVVHATETCYGITCDLSNPHAVQKLFLIKDRSPLQPVSALFPSVSAASSFVDFSPLALTLAAKHLPGPLTLVLPKRADAPSPIYVTPPELSPLEESGERSTVGVRISPHPVALALVRGLGRPIATTSANLHGKDNPYSAIAVEKEFKGREYIPDLILDNGVLPLAPPSTVVEIIGANVRILRQGDITV